MPALLEMLESQEALHISQTITSKNLPKIGFIAFFGSQPVAAGFLRKLEPTYCQIDTLVSMGLLGSLIRHQGVTGVVAALLDEAKRLKLDGIMAITTDSSVLKRAKELGFTIFPQSIIVKSLRD
jgi:hypothetical protein